MGIPALKNRLINQLRQSIQALSPNGEITDIEIPLHQIRGRFPVIYQSAIAHRLGSGLNQSAITIATRLVPQFQSESTESFLSQDKLGSGFSQPDLTLQVMSSGKIQFEFTDVGIAHWLHQMTQIPPVETRIQPNPYFPDPLFPVQYSHARCCSLLRRAHRDHLISLTPAQPLTPPCLWQFRYPHPVPWLTPQQQLQLTHPAEQSLIVQLITTVDSYCTCSYSPQWEQMADHLSQAFQQFYSQCQIWGNIKQNTPQLAQARLGLVFVTQFMLQLILQEKLNVIAPMEL